MKINKDLEKLLMSVKLKTTMNIVVTDEEEIIYYIGNSDECGEYLFKNMSKELKLLLNDLCDKTKYLKDNKTIKITAGKNQKYKSQAIFKITKDDKFDKSLIFYKLDSEFDNSDIFMIDSVKYLIEKYFN